jgi:hypothetical protein
VLAKRGRKDLTRPNSLQLEVSRVIRPAFTFLIFSIYIFL